MLVYLVVLILPVPTVSKLDWLFCPSTKAVEPFDLNRYLGTWYEAAKFPNRFQKDLRCVTAQYSKKDDGNLKVTNCGVKKGTDTLDEVEGEAYQPKEGVGDLRVRFSKFSLYGQYKVIKTDYDNYSLVYSCTNFGLFHSNYFWILVRDRSFATDRYVSLLKEFATKLGIKTQFLVTTNNTKCIDH